MYLIIRTWIKVILLLLLSVSAYSQDVYKLDSVILNVYNKKHKEQLRQTLFLKGNATCTNFDGYLFIDGDYISAFRLLDLKRKRDDKEFCNSTWNALDEGFNFCIVHFVIEKQTNKVTLVAEYPDHRTISYYLTQ